LPLSLGSIQALEQLDAKNNSLSTFTSPFPQKSAYSNLNYLDLSANRIKVIPKDVLGLRKLRTLHLSYNSITDVECLWNPNFLPQIEILDLSNNQIQEISDHVGNKKSLNYLNLENNNLTKIPTCIGFMALSGFKIDGNPLKLIKRAIITKGTVPILNYLRDKHQG